MKIKRTFICEFCGRDDFDSERECMKHETMHSLEDRLKAFPDATACPSCGGTGVFCESKNSGVGICPVCCGQRIIRKIKNAKTESTLD